MLGTMYAAFVGCHLMAAPLMANIQEMIAQSFGGSVRMPFTFSVSRSGCQHKQSSVVLFAEDLGNSSLLQQLLHQHHHLFLHNEK